MNPDELRRLFPNASAATLAANLPPRSAGAAAEPQRTVRDAALGKGKAQKGDRGRFLVRVESVRKRLLDADNLVEKFHVDLCRYAGILPDDAPGICEIQTTQRKAAKGEQEHVVIEIYTL